MTLIFKFLGTPAFCKLEKILSNKRILKAVAKLSPHHQTSSLEAFHGVILRFAPKNVVFCWSRTPLLRAVRWMRLDLY